METRPPERPELTSRQRLALSVIARYIDDRGIAPTYAEIADALGAASATSAVHLVESLEEKGYVRRTPGRARSLRVIRDSDTPGRDEVIRIPRADIEDADGRIREGVWVDRMLVGGSSSPARCRCIRIGDGGMSPVGIRMGDLVVLEPVDERTLLSGDLAGCLIDDVPVIRRIRRETDGIRLTAAEPSFTTVVIREFGAAIPLLGRPVMLTRRM
ncbi:MAG: hypothetical protein HKN17_04470 [Rhodothermales bacterium]|nr:hypothetical protein [Rhodothermales bacterium]